MSLFKKPKRNFRQRIARHDSDEENNVEADEEKKNAPVHAAPLFGTGDETIGKSLEKRLKNIKSTNLALTPSPVIKAAAPCVAGSTNKSGENNGKIGSTTNLAGTLSFTHEEEDEEGEVFKVKKSSYSRRLAKQLEKERKKKNKRDLEVIQPHLPSSSSFADDDEIDQERKHSEEKPELRIMNGEDLEMELNSDDDDDEDEEENNQESLYPFRKILESGSIPDAAMIHAARKRRQMAREMSDFITLDDNENTEKNNSRLIRDDDNDRSDDEDSGGRLSFNVTAPLAKDRAREALLAISQKGQGGSDDEADEELERWEQEQIRKGVSIPQVQALQQESQLYPSYAFSADVGSGTSYVPPDTSRNVTEIKSESAEIPSQPLLLPLTSDMPVFTLERLEDQLSERLESLQQVHRAHQLERDSRLNDLVTSESHIVELEEKAPGISQAFTFYQEMRGYVTDLVECLDEKVAVVNTLEQNIMLLMKQRANRLVQRRQQDIKDQSEEFPAVFSKPTAAVAPLHDPFNREKTALETARARRAAEREGRRTRRRRIRESRGTNIKHYDGMSSDDEEMEADISQFNMEKERLMEEADGIFEDVIDDFQSVSSIKARFERWKREYPNSYKNAYIGLCLPKVFMPFVRLQLLTWNPLEECGDFEETRWFESLMFFSYQEGLTQDDLRQDSDVNLIPLLVERIMLPKLTEYAEGIWDPMSTSQTLRFGNLIRKLMNEYPTVNGKSKKTQALLKAVVDRMRKTLDDDVFIPTYPKTILENKALGANNFFHRQYWSCVKLLRNFCSWQGIVADHLLQDLALHGLFNRYLLWAMHNSPANRDSLEKAKMITATIPRCWFTQRLSDNTIPQLEMFCRYLKTLADTMDKNGVNGTLSEKAEAKENIKEIAKMLVNIGAMDHALTLVNQFSLKDLKSMVSGVKD